MDLQYMPDFLQITSVTDLLYTRCNLFHCSTLNQYSEADIYACQQTATIILTVSTQCYLSGDTNGIVTVT